ncbi:MAG: lytic transglycosylase domain-containing protein [Oceanospirillaceae bacterium]|nr:lytic transglycosylase domain-containing protein [Oceanospirillaceae bacterium]
MLHFLRALVPVFLLLSHAACAQQPTDISPSLRAALKHSIAQASSFSDRFEAEVWLVDMSGRIGHWVSDELERLQILKAVHAQANNHQLPIDLVLGLIETESHFNRFALSSTGAQGLMQIMPFWKLEIGQPQDNLINIDTNIRYGCAILQHYIQIENGNISKALARYNGSVGSTRYPTKVRRNQEKYQ